MLLQFFVSAACLSTAEANETSTMVPVTAHCHKVNMTAIDDTDVHHSTAKDLPCDHCDTPEMALSASVPAMSDHVLILLGVIEWPESVVVPSFMRLSWLEKNAPPHSFSLLYQTSHRILI
ncbi:MAG: hypothetical protein Q9M09_05160 [Mariprofundaceae bacterium]|nr:hypothetical protein [Mariprofundaceae bacterium]